MSDDISVEILDDDVESDTAAQELTDDDYAFLAVPESEFTSQFLPKEETT
jgi:hypothetical protein